MTTYTKIVTNMSAYNQIDGETDVVFSVNWTLAGESGPYKAFYPTTTNVPYTAGSPFTPYNELTNEQVLGWIEEYTPQEDMDRYTAEVDSMLLAQQNQSTLTPPWLVSGP